MPPRRSSRSTRASVEPSPAPESLPAKRKRSSRESVEIPDEKDYNARSRRGSSVRSSGKARVSARSRGKPLEEVPETDEEEEEEESAPAKKKSRPSLEPEDDDDEEDASMEEEDEKPKSRTTRKTRVIKTEDAEDEDRRGQSKQSRTKQSRSSRSSKAPSSRSRKAASAAFDDEEDMDPVADESDSDRDEDERPVKKGRKAAKPASKKSKSLRKAVLVSDDELEEPVLSSTRPKQAPKATPAVVDVPDIMSEIEEEHSLLDPVIPPLSPSTHPQTQLPIPEEAKEPQARLVIHKMALVNFKSYAGRQEIGPFHKSFSSIVGPNGSGKSNTIDALLFVFGYRASKMRQGKVSELIHNSAAYPDLDECSVEVHFRDIIDQPGDAFRVVPGSSLVVARQAFKTNSSRYTINGRPSNYKEVQTLLKGRGIDLDHNRFLILQGEVESIAQMKPKGSTEHEDGLLEYLEDIIGTSQYKTPIDEALVEVEALQEARGDKINRLRLVEKEKDALQAKKKEAEDYLRLQNAAVEANNKLIQWNIWKAFEDGEKYEKQKNKIETDLNNERAAYKDDFDHHQMLLDDLAERQQVYNQLRDDATKATAEVAEFEKKAVSVGERLKHATSQVKKLKKAVQDNTNQLNTSQRMFEDSRDKMKKERTKIEEHEIELAKEEKALEAITESLKDKTQVFHDQIETKQRELQPWMTKINEKEAEINVAISERDSLAKRAEALKTSVNEASQTLKELRTDQEAKMQEQARLREEKGTLQQNLRKAEKVFQDAHTRVASLRAKANASNRKFEEARSSQAEAKSQDSVLQTLTQLKTTGRIQGFHGRLGSLGTIPEQYDVAITTACGALNNMVVDKVDQGQACIEHLRNKNVGRASFLVLEKLQVSNRMQPFPTPENVPRLFDLVTIKDNKFAPAFYKALGDTLVAQDLEQANRIAYGRQRYRVVTLAGEVIDTSGTMSGGGGRPQRGGMSSKFARESVSADTLRDYQRESESAANELQEAQVALANAEKALASLKDNGPNIDTAYEKLGMDIQTGKMRIQDAEKRFKELQAQNKPNSGDLVRIDSLDNQIATWETELAELKKKAGKIEDAITVLQDKIKEIGGSKLMSQKSKVEGLRMLLGLANNEITKAEVTRDKAQKDVEKYKANVKTNSDALQEAQEEADTRKEELAELNGLVDQARAHMDAAREAEESSKEKLQELKDEVDEKTERIQEFKKKELKLTQQLDDINKDIKKVDDWISEQNKLHKALTLNEIPDDDDDLDVDDDEDEEGTSERATAEAEGPDNEGTAIKPDPEGDDGDDDDSPNAPKKNDRGLVTYKSSELSRCNSRDLKANVDLAEEQLARAKPNLGVLDEYKIISQKFNKCVKELDDVTAKRDKQKQKYDDLTKQRLEEFMAGFNTISLKLKEMYQMITLGGNAELELVDSMDPFAEGIIFSVMPPKKSWKNISNLSGGEKTLSSLALVFALHVFKPTPLYFMDEIDAALDFRNVSIVANYIKDRTKNAQFIIISLRNDMFELSHRLIGIYKTSNATKSISIDNHALTTRPAPTQAAM